MLFRGWSILRGQSLSGRRDRPRQHGDFVFFPIVTNMFGAVRARRYRRRSMHIPDGFLDAKTGLATWALAVTGLAVALRHARQTLPPRKVPLLGLSAAFVFAAQMVNFPIGAG